MFNFTNIFKVFDTEKIDGIKIATDLLTEYNKKKTIKPPLNLIDFVKFIGLDGCYYDDIEEIGQFRDNKIVVNVRYRNNIELSRYLIVCILGKYIFNIQDNTEIKLSENDLIYSLINKELLKFIATILFSGYDGIEMAYHFGYTSIYEMSKLFRVDEKFIIHIAKIKNILMIKEKEKYI